MALDPALAAILQNTAAAPALTALPPAEARAVFDQLAVSLGRTGGVEVGDVRDDEVAGVPVRVYRPATDGPLPTVVFAHGGGWVIGSVETHDGLARRLCRDAGVVVVSVDYRLAPEAPFPAAVDDVTAVFDAVAAGVDGYGGDAARLGVAGDSAGANLAAVLALHARDTGTPLAAQLLFYPATDLGGDFASMAENAEGYFLTRADTAWFAAHYLGGDRALTTDPRVSPARAPSLADLAPAVVVTAGFDPLRDDGDAYAAALEAAGGRVVHRRFDELIHGFTAFTGLSPACEAATAWTLAQFATLLRG